MRKRDILAHQIQIDDTYKHLILQTDSNMRKLLTTFCLSAIALGMSCASKAEGVEIDGLKYNLDATNRTATVTWGGKCYCVGDTYKGEVVIPKTVTYDGVEYAVTTIGEHAFMSSRGLTGVTIPESVTEIEKSAFAGCPDLTSVTFSGKPTISRIGGKAFLFCKSLESIEIPASVESIGAYAFEICENLKDVEWADGSKLTTIDDYVFCRTGLSSISIPASATAIKAVAFCTTPNMTEVYLPAQVTSISEQNPFCYNSQVTSMRVADGNKVYDSRKECNAIIETATNTLVAGCKETVIPASVTAIGRSAFNHCADLTDAALPATIRSIGKYAYMACTGLKSFYFPSTMKVMADSVFWKVERLDSIVTMAQRPFAIDESDFEQAIYDNSTLYVPAGTASLYHSAAVWSKFRNIVEMGKFVIDGITYIVRPDGKVEVGPASEGVDYDGTITIPTEVVSGTKVYEVDGATADAFSNQDKAVKVIWKGKLKQANFTAYGQKGVIRIEGTDAEAQVYGTNGVMLTSTTKRAIPVEPGIYFVKVDGVSFKVIVD